MSIDKNSSVPGNAAPGPSSGSCVCPACAPGPRVASQGRWWPGWWPDRASGTALCAVLGRSFLRERLLRQDVTGQRTEKPATQDTAPSEPPIPVGRCSGMNRVPPKFMPTGTRVWPDLGIGCLKT